VSADSVEGIISYIMKKNYTACFTNSFMLRFIRLMNRKFVTPDVTGNESRLSKGVAVNFIVPTPVEVTCIQSDE
jgi:hypothetical protein